MSKIPLLIFAFGMLVFGIALYQEQNPKDPLFISKPLPSLTWQDLTTGEKVTSDELHPKGPYLLHYFASWCGVCAEEHGRLVALQQSLPLPLYGVVWQDQKPAIESWLKGKKNPYQQVLLDSDSSTGILMGIYGIPETFLIQEGQIILQHKGPLSEEIWREKLAPFFASQ